MREGRFTFLLFVYVQLVLSRTILNESVHDIYILGLFPMDGAWTGGLGIEPAAEIAIEYVNRDTTILPGYRLNLIWNDTKCNAGVGVKAVAERLGSCNGPTFIMVLGGGCSIVSQAVAEATHLWNLVQVSFMSTSPALSNRNKYPYFFRVINPAQYLNYPRIELLKRFNWTKVTTIHQSYQLFSTMVENLEDLMNKINITILKKYVFSENPTQIVSHLKRNDARIIVGAFYEDKALQLFCEAFRIGFHGAKIVWLLPGFYPPKWWENENKNCTSDQILSVIGNYFTVDSVFLKDDVDKPDDNGITPRQFMNDYKKKTKNRKLPGYVKASAGYDSVWTIANALNATLNDLRNTGYRLEDFSYTNSFMGELIKNNTNKVNFSSISSQVSFDQNGDPGKLMKIQQLQGGDLVTIGWYNKLSIGNETTWSKSSHILWPNGNLPRDSVQTVTKLTSVSMSLYVVVCILATLGILLALAFLIFNIKFRSVRVIKMSSPNINSVILLGCIIVYAFVFIHGVDSIQVPWICQVKGFFMLVGFSLAFGALLAKSWRVYVIYTASQKLQKRAPKDLRVFLKVMLLTALNVSVLIIWTTIDPLQPKEIRLDDFKVNDTVNDRVVIPLTYFCSSRYQIHFSVTLLAIQGILLLLGAFLAFTTRKVTIPALNDSHYIGMCIYNVVVLGAVGVPVSLVLKNHIDVTYALVSVLIIIGTTATQCLIFVPKVFALKDFLKGDMTNYASEFCQTINTVTPSAMHNSTTALHPNR